MPQANINIDALPLPTERNAPMRHGDFDTLCDALDYAATCETGFNYFDGKARLKESLPYVELREKAIEMAKRLVLFAEKDARIGIAAVSTRLPICGTCRSPCSSTRNFGRAFIL